MSVYPGHPGSDPLPDRILPPPVAAEEWSLEPTRSVLAALGDPHRAAPTLHVAGTNGKGSVAAIWASVLSAAGHRVGLYTSPHLCAYRERIRIDGVPISREAVERAAASAYDAIDRGRLSFFEAGTVLAFQAFAREGVDVAVIEVGLGGRLDATNVVEPVLTAITNVALDHEAFLGSSLASIAAEKAGIIKPGVPVVTGATEPDALAVIRETAARRGAPLSEVGPGDLQDLHVGPDRSRFTIETGAWGPLALEVRLVGRHQAANAGLAVRGLELLPEALLPDAGAVFRGVAGVSWPGRLQVVREAGVTWVFDVAHNPAGARALAAALGGLDLPRPLVAVVGVLSDKDWSTMILTLADVVDGLVLTDPPSAPPDRRWDARAAAVSLHAAAGSALRVPVSVEPDLGAALEQVARDGGTGVVTGSHHTVGDALLLMGHPPCEPG